MKIWPFSRTEERASVEEAIASHLVDNASGQGAPAVGALAAVETAAGLWSRAFASANVEPLTLATSALTPSIRASIGRQLAVRGEAVYKLAFAGGRLTMQLCESWEVQGGSDPSLWTYAIERSTPGGLVKETIGADQVVHVRYAVKPAAPWQGISPLAFAEDTRVLAGWIERRLSEEVKTSTGYVMPLPAGQKPHRTTYGPDLKQMKGMLLLVDSMATAWGGGKDTAPKADWERKAHRGFDPPASVTALRQDVRGDVLSCYGIGQLFATGGQAREAYRQFLVATIQPLAQDCF